MNTLQPSNNFTELSTFDLAFNLATGKYSEKEKFEILEIIKSREGNSPEAKQAKEKPATKVKPPLPGSKAEKIYNLLKSGKEVKEVYEMLKKKKLIIYYPEIYRIKRDYNL